MSISSKSVSSLSNTIDASRDMDKGEQLKLRSILSTAKQQKRAKGDAVVAKIFDASMSLAEKTCDSNDPAGPLVGKKFSLDIPSIEEGACTGRTFGAEPDEETLQMEQAKNKQLFEILRERARKREAKERVWMKEQKKLYSRHKFGYEKYDALLSRVQMRSQPQ